MSLEETQAKLLHVSKSVDDFFNTILELYNHDITSSNELLIAALSGLHNSGRIDFINLLREIEYNSETYNTRKIVQLFVKVLPLLNAEVVALIECLVHLMRNKSVHGWNSAYINFCKAKKGHPKKGIDYILEQSDKNTYVSLLSDSIIAYSFEDTNETICLIKKLLVHENAAIRKQVYLSSWQLNIDINHVDNMWDVIKSSLLYESDNDCRASILEASLRFGKTFPAYWPQIEIFLNEFLEEISKPQLLIVSYYTGIHTLPLPESVFQFLLKKLSRVTPDDKDAIDNIDNLLVRLVENKQYILAENLLESIVSAGVNFSSLDYFSHEVFKKNVHFLNQIATKWLLNGNYALCDGLSSLFLNSTEENFQLKADVSLLVSEEQKGYICRKIIGWLFFRPVTAASFILSIYDIATKKSQIVIEDILYAPLILSYPGEMKEFLVSCIEDNFQNELCNRMLEKIKLHQEGINDALEIKELRTPIENILAYNKDQEKSMQKAMDNAAKSSILSVLAKPQNMLYGNSSIYYMYKIDGEPVRQETEMHLFSYSTEIPRLSVLDPVSLELFLFECRREVI
ncbi:hypothetical protein [Pantoea ananatis]